VSKGKCEWDATWMACCRSMPRPVLLRRHLLGFIIPLQVQAVMYA
jgi:hypothetical protein